MKYYICLVASQQAKLDAASPQAQLGSLPAGEA